MRRFFAFWWYCVRTAFWQNSPFANDWQWIFGNPLVTVFSTSALVLLGAIAPIFAKWVGAIEMTTGYPWLDSFLGALAAFIVTWAIAFIVKIFVVPVARYHEEKHVSDELREKISILSTELKEKHSPNLNGRIETVIVGDSNGTATCVLNVTVRNIGMPSIIDGWRISAQCNGKKYPCNIIAFQENITLEPASPEMPTLIIKPSEYIYEKTLNPIATGGLERGWLASIVTGINRASLNVDGTIFVVEYNDVLGKSYSSTYTLQKGDSGPPRYVPGAGGQYRPAGNKGG